MDTFQGSNIQLSPSAGKLTYPKPLKRTTICVEGLKSLRNLNPWAYLSLSIVWIAWKNKERGKFSIDLFIVSGILDWQMHIKGLI